MLGVYETNAPEVKGIGFLSVTMHTLDEYG